VEEETVMLTLGVHDGHTATACLFEDGEVIACISEERLNRIKDWAGFPEEAIKKCLEITGKSPEEIDAVGVCSLMPQIGTEHYHNPQLYKRLFSYLTKIVPESMLQSPRNIRIANRIGELLFRSRKSLIAQRLSDIAVTTKNVFFFEHHLLHAATAYYASWYRDRKNLVVTLDGSGDAVCATVNVGTNGSLERIAEVFNYNSICDFYTRVTQFLGMKPMSHEYKVMGLAPYASQNGTTNVIDCFRNYFKVCDGNPLLFANTSGLWKWQFGKALANNLIEKRFDGIAGAVQKLFEEVIVQWIKNAISDTHVTDLALAGGGFMNVKLNYLISQLPQVSSLFILPSCGDESNPVGGAMLAALKIGFPHEAIKPLGMVYWGSSYGNDVIEKSISKMLGGSGLNIKRFENANHIVAERIADGKIVGRLTGRMEWGARALGNRSIVADPRNGQTIHKINKAIKMRDFWMPFAPAILREYRDKYVLLREDFRCPFMTVAPDTKPKAWDDIPAGLHPFDKTSRIQVLDPASHPSFYELVSAYESITGVGGVLNTSFNLHGDPIVCSPEDAIYTFLNSGLDVLQLEDYIIEKSQ
jgi:carbamoyltransferase